ncbi:MAG: hypothetical protein JSS66_03175 [Armatimonadetes bacterium]|nr:hypothetical protein [Armatimonadota bacterium]
MKRWLPWLGVPVVVTVLLFFFRLPSAGPLKDTDTTALLEAIQKRHAPLSWFTGDWPLGNHFYRPVSTLIFELDQALHPGNPAAFGLTNVVLAVLCVWGVFWLFRELTETPWMTGLATGLFGVWHLWDTGPILGSVCWFMACVGWIGFLRGGWKSLVPAALATFVWAFTATQAAPVDMFGWRVIGWLPGRTASTMTVFALAALACYARYERLTTRPVLKQPTALDVPATKGTEVARDPSPLARGLLLTGALLGTALALASYEQAVMLPALLLGVAVWMMLKGRRPHWWPHVAFWLVLLGYLAVRAKFVPNSASGYQLQQFRNGPGVKMVLADYFLPGFNESSTLLLTLSGGVLMWLTAAPWTLSFSALGNVASWLTGWRQSLRPHLLGSYALAAIAFLPMAWLQPFGHYHYWPSAFRALYFVCLFAAGLKVLANAVSLPSLQAPPRQSPAPGSLLRP